MPVKAWDTHHAVQLLTCCTLMLALAHPVAPSSRSAVTAPAAPTPNPPAPATPPTVQSPPAPVATPPTVPSAPIIPVAPANKHVWDINYILWAPDCKQHGMIGINGQFPGPTIDAYEGDTITVVVNNKLHTEGVVIHWHGIRQIDTPWADGTASISQCPINPGVTFTYKFKVDKPGTYFYHGHFGMQRAAGLYGSLIVHERVDPYKKEPNFGGELNMLLSDWYHEAVYAQAAGLERKDDHFQWVGEPQTLLINGTGQFGCTLGKVGEFDELWIHRDAKKCDRKDGQVVEAACDRNCGLGGKAVTDSCIKDENCNSKTGPDKEKCEADCTTKGNDSEEETKKVVCEDEKKTNCAMILRSECGPFCRKTQCGPVVFDVEPDKMYRLRIASTTSLSALNVQVEKHKLTVVEADGNFVEPVDVDNLDIYSGESYSVLLNTTAAKQGSSPYWISVGVIGRKPKTLPALAVLRYAGSAAELPARLPPATPSWDDVERSKKFTKKLKARAGSSVQVPKADRRIDMLNIQDMVDGQIKWAINHVSLELPATPYLGAYLYGIEGKVFNTTALPDTYHRGYDIHKPPQKQELAVRPATVVSNQVYTLKHNEVVDVVLQNADMRTDNVSESHPWHLHGHDFWVLGYGEGEYNDSKTEALDVEKPPLRNTVVLFPHGWTVIRFKADNPGVWAFHCHIEPHLHMGMGVVFAEGMDVEGMKGLKENVPGEAMMCGKTAVVAAVAAPPLAPATPPPSP